MFFGKTGSNMHPWTDVAHTKSCSPRTDLSNELLSVSNGDQMSKLRPRKLRQQLTQTGHSFGASSPKVRFLDV